METGNLDPERQAKIEFGVAIRRLRKEAGLTQEILARRVGYSRVYITNVENGRDLPGEEFVRLVASELDAAAEIKPLFAAVLTAHRSNRPSTPLAGLLEAASPINLLPRIDRDDLLLVQAESLDGELILVNINRREALRRLGAAAAFAAIDPQVKIINRVAPPSPGTLTPIQHLRGMYRTLIESDDMFGSGHAIAGTHEQLKIIEHIIDTTRGADRQGLMHLRAQFAESMAWLTQDQADYDSAWQWTDRALEWAHLAGDPTLIAVVFIRKSQLAGDLGGAANALDFAAAALNAAPGHTRLPAVAHLCAGHGYALAGQQDESARAYGAARDLLAKVELDPDHDWGAWLDEAYISAQQARALSALGKKHEAINSYTAAISALPESFPRERGVHLSRAAYACSRAGEPEQASALAIEALQIEQIMRSGRIQTQLRSVLDELDPIDTEAVSAFRELAHTANLV